VGSAACKTPSGRRGSARTGRSGARVRARAARSRTSMVGATRPLPLLVGHSPSREQAEHTRTVQGNGSGPPSRRIESSITPQRASPNGKSLTKRRCSRTCSGSKVSLISRCHGPRHLNHADSAVGEESSKTGTSGVRSSRRAIQFSSTPTDRWHESPSAAEEKGCPDPIEPAHPLTAAARRFPRSCRCAAGFGVCEERLVRAHRARAPISTLRQPGRLSWLFPMHLNPLPVDYRSRIATSHPAGDGRPRHFFP
jgi:hypothetical protein